MRGEKMGRSIRSLFDKVFGKYTPSGKLRRMFKTFTAYQPVFTSYSGGIYESELCRSAIHALANHTSKLKVTVTGQAKNIAFERLNRRPNDFQTWGQFLYRLRTILEVQNTAFIAPIRNDFGALIGLYPLLPSQCTINEDSSGDPWLVYTFRNGQKAATKLSETSILTKMQYDDDFFGASNAAMMPTMQLIHVQNQGITEAVKSSAAFRFMAQLDNWANDEDLAKEQRNFTEMNMSSDSGGVVVFPYNWTNVQQIKSTPYVVDAEQMKLIDTRVFNYFGVNEDVLQNKTNGDAWDAFYEGAIETFAIQLSDILTMAMENFGGKQNDITVAVTANRLQYMSVRDKIAFCKEMGDRGYILIDEGREVFQMAALPDGEGQRAPVRGEYYFLGEKKEDGKNGTDE